MGSWVGTVLQEYEDKQLVDYEFCDCEGGLFFCLRHCVFFVLYCVFILSAISPYITGLKVLFNQSDCTDTAPTHK